MRKEIRVERVEPHYVNTDTDDDCVQVTIPYIDNMSLIGPEGFLYGDLPEEGVLVNKYLGDKRRKLFPYSDIPKYYGKSRILGKTVTYVNQLLNLNTPYLCLDLAMDARESMTELYAVMDKDRALLVQKDCWPLGGLATYLSRKELQDLLDGDWRKESDEKLFIVQGNDMCSTLLLHDDEEVVQGYKDKSIEILKKNSLGGDYSFFKNLIENATVKSLPQNYHLFSDALRIETGRGHIAARLISSVEFTYPDSYRVMIHDIPIKYYSLGQVKNMARRPRVCRELKINPRLNPDIRPEDIKANEDLVIKLKATRKNKEVI